MPPLPPVNHVLRCAITGLLAGTPWANILHVGYSGTLPIALSANAFATKIGLEWLSVWKPMQSHFLVYSECKVTDLTAPLAGVGVVALGGHGAVIGGSVPNQVAMLVHWSSALRYRGGHPRSYIPGLWESQLHDSKTWVAALVALAQARLIAFEAVMGLFSHGGTTLTGLRVVHYRRHAAPLVPPQVEDILGGTIELEVATQRRRLGR